MRVCDLNLPAENPFRYISSHKDPIKPSKNRRHFVVPSPEDTAGKRWEGTIFCLPRRRQTGGGQKRTAVVVVIPSLLPPLLACFAYVFFNLHSLGTTQQQKRALGDNSERVIVFGIRAATLIPQPLGDREPSPADLTEQARSHTHTHTWCGW